MNRNEFGAPEEGVIAAFSRALGNRNRVQGRAGGVATLGIAVCLAIVLAAVLWFGYPRGSQQAGGDLAVPLVRAQGEPYRSKPDDPGGMDVPHRDSTVFDTLRKAEGADTGGEKVENLLSDDEQPVPRERLFAGLNTAQESPPQAATEEAGEAGPQNILGAPPQPAARSNRDLTEKASQSSTASPAPAAPAKSGDMAQVSEETRALVKSVLREEEQARAETGKDASSVEPAAGPASAAAATTASVSGVAKPASPSRGSHYVQLASLQSRDAAESAWKIASKKNAGVLTNVSYRVQSAEVPGRGTFYRLQAGPFERAEADRICGEIKQGGGSCLVVAR